MKLEILAFAAHPDDVELTMGGTILLQSRMGRKVGIVDLTRGELGTRGNAETRIAEANAAGKMLGIAVRENLGMKDGFIRNDEASRVEVIKMIRQYRPEVIFCNSISDRHPDHGHASKMVSDAVFLSGLPKMITEYNGNRQEPWKVGAVYHYIQDRYLKPDFIVDITSVMQERMEAVKAFTSQFYNATSTEPETAISSKAFLEFLIARAREFGRPAGVEFAEGFQAERTICLKDPFELK